MLHTLDNRIHRLASRRNVLLLTLIFIGVSVLLFNVGPVSQLEEMSNGMGLLDNKFGYSATRVYTLFDTLGEEGRQLYRTWLLSLDMLYGILFAVTNSLLLAYLLEALLGPRRYFVFLSLLPFVATLFDMLENVSLLMLLWRYPARHPSLAFVAEVLTATKLTLVNFLMIVTLVTLAGVLVKAVYARYFAG